MEANHRYNPKIDLVFRKLFGSEENKDLLISLINGVLDSHPLITDLTIKNPYSLATYFGGKNSIVDIKAVDTQGCWYDIEMQIGEHGFYGKRAQYYLAKLFVDQLGEGEDYTVLNPTIGIHLLDFDYFSDARYRRHFVYKDMETNECPEELKYQQLYFIEMSKFRKDWHEQMTLLDRWIAFLNKAQKLSSNDMPATLQEEPEIVKAFKTLNRISFNAQEREIYEAELKARLDDHEELRTAKEKGRVEGREEGIAEGEARAMQQALDKLTASGIPSDEARRLLGMD